MSHWASLPLMCHIEPLLHSCVTLGSSLPHVSHSDPSLLVSHTEPLNHSHHTEPLLYLCHTEPIFHSHVILSPFSIHVTLSYYSILMSHWAFPSLFCHSIHLSHEPSSLAYITLSPSSIQLSHWACPSFMCHTEILLYSCVTLKFFSTQYHRDLLLICQLKYSSIHVLH